jgi:anoctamin-10/anoctamin-7
MYILETHTYADLHLNKLVADGSILAYFPLREDNIAADLQSKWLGLMVPSWRQPLNAVKNYFGEKIGLYFCFLAHYTSWMLPIALIGIGIFIDMIVRSVKDKDGLIFQVSTYQGSAIYSIIISLWCQLFLTYWSRREKYLAYSWGMEGYEKLEKDRAEFIGEEIQSVVDGKKIKYFDNYSKYSRQFISFIVLIFTVAVVVCFISFVIYWRSINTLAAALINAVGIQVLLYLHLKLLLSLYILVMAIDIKQDKLWNICRNDHI